MSPTLSEDDVGKDVVNAQGEQIGVVKSVTDGVAHVDADPSVTDKIRSKLGWEETDRDDYPLQTDSIDTVTDDEIRLDSGL